MPSSCSCTESRARGRADNYSSEEELPVVRRREVEIGELLGEAQRGTAVADVLQVGQIGLDAAGEAREGLAVGQAELGRQVVVIEQADLVDPAGSGSEGSISIRR